MSSSKDVRPLEAGIERRFHCSQAADFKKRSRAKNDPNIKNRQNPGMDRFACRGRLNVWCLADDERLEVRVKLTHECQHVPYTSVALPEEASEYILANLNFTPTVLYEGLAKTWPALTQGQVYATWMRKLEGLWKKDNDPTASVHSLFHAWSNDIDIFELSLPKGVTAIAWGVKSIATQISNRVVEVAMDATCKYIIHGRIASLIISY